jgi:hypothetical protein
MAKITAEDIMPVVHDKLRTRYGEIRIVSGQGIAKGQRVEFQDGGKTVRCVIKTSTGGRISFGRREDGSWSGLSESDRVVVVAPTTLGGDDLVVSEFKQHVLMQAFEANLAAQKKAGMDKVPSWLAPFHEVDRGVRGTGDGFGDKALWQEPLATAGEASPKASAVGKNEPARGLTLAEAKEGLARTFGVSPDAIEITIRG